MSGEIQPAEEQPGRSLVVALADKVGIYVRMCLEVHENESL